MQIHVTSEVAKWYKNELGLETGDYIRFFPRYGGVGGNIPGFSIGINTDQPDDIETSTVKEGLSLYIEKQDTWYFDNKDFEITLNKQLNEPEFNYM